MLFVEWGKGRNCRGKSSSLVYQDENLQDCATKQTSAILRSIFDAPDEKRGDARLVSGNSIRFSCFGSVSSVKLYPTNQLVFVIHRI